jgi:hypothetical protein
LIPSYHAFGGYQYPIFCYFSVEGRLFLKKNGETVEKPIVEGFFNGGRGWEDRLFSAKSDGSPIEILKNPQLFRFNRCEVVEGLSFGLWDIHIEVMVGDDTDGITGNV